MYGEVFKNISQEDQEYMTDVIAAAEFGNSQSVYEEVSIIGICSSRS